MSESETRLCVNYNKMLCEAHLKICTITIDLKFSEQVSNVKCKWSVLLYTKLIYSFHIATYVCKRAICTLFFFFFFLSQKKVSETGCVSVFM
jgi:hypothetical protein